MNLAATSASPTSARSQAHLLCWRVTAPSRDCRGHVAVTRPHRQGSLHSLQRRPLERQQWVTVPGDGPRSIIWSWIIWWRITISRRIVIRVVRRGVLEFFDALRAVDEINGEGDLSDLSLSPCQLGPSYQPSSMHAWWSWRAMVCAGGSASCSCAATSGYPRASVLTLWRRSIRSTVAQSGWRRTIHAFPCRSWDTLPRQTLPSADSHSGCLTHRPQAQHGIGGAA